MTYSVYYAINDAYFLKIKIMRGELFVDSTVREAHDEVFLRGSGDAVGTVSEEVLAHLSQVVRDAEGADVLGDLLRIDRLYGRGKVGLTELFEEVRAGRVNLAEVLSDPHLAHYKDRHGVMDPMAVIGGLGGIAVRNRGRVVKGTITDPD